MVFGDQGSEAFLSVLEAGEDCGVLAVTVVGAVVGDTQLEE